jgi:hypothetical protein
VLGWDTGYPYWVIRGFTQNFEANSEKSISVMPQPLLSNALRFIVHQPSMLYGTDTDSIVQFILLTLVLFHLP